ncbi:cache domain-containing protein [uncultured Arcobacter sp.]|uniref:cache domain-containing protein n=1 Tax=uncultured Arcobacter sp. TaxID=165434 RepID=UPI00262CD551|nr:cache domain-containing protein [uncultured Arcobacter sp.]
MNFFESKSNKYFLATALLSLVFITFIFYVLLNINNEKKLISKLENSLVITKNLLEEEKRYALSLSILLAEDKELIKAYSNDERLKVFNIVNKKINTLKKLQNTLFEVQVHTKELNTYIRSWDFSIKDIPLSSFRQGLVKVKEDKKPLVSIELGKRLNIKAISPIIDNNNFIGSIEVIIGFEHIEKELKQKAYELCILLDDKYLNIATSLKNNQKLDGFTLVNQKETLHSHKFSLKELKDYGYFTNKELGFSYFTYYSLKKEKLGYFIISSKNSSKLQLNENYENIYTKQESKVFIQ